MLALPVQGSHRVGVQYPVHATRKSSRASITRPSPRRFNPVPDLATSKLPSITSSTYTLSYVKMEAKGVQMDEDKGPRNGNIETSYINDDDFVDQHDGAFNLARKYMGTAADQHDMSVLGRNQVLRVSMLSTSMPCAIPLTSLCAAQLSLHLDCGVL